MNRFRLFALAALLAAGCSKPLEFADASPLAELLPEDLKAEEGVPHPAAVLFGEFQDSLLFHTDSFDWYEDNYSTGELVDSEDFAYTWREGVRWRDLPSEDSMAFGGSDPGLRVRLPRWQPRRHEPG